MSLLKVNNPRSLLIKAENNHDTIGNRKKRVITIKSAKNEAQKVVINVVNPPEPKVLKIKQETPVVVKTEPSSTKHDQDLQIPSELFHCHFKEEKDEANEIPGEYYFETDHEVLRSNPDYQALIRSLAVLQAKKIQV